MASEFIVLDADELGHHGPLQMWDLDLSYDPTPETWEEAERLDEQSKTLWRFSGTVKYPTKFRRNGLRWVAVAWEERHTGVHYTVEEHGWGCKPDCDKEHGWVEFVNPAESAVPAAYYFCLREGIPVETLD